MELTLLLSVKVIVLHIITQDLKIFRQKCYTLFSLLSFNFELYCTNGLPLLHKVVLHYQIIPACNISHFRILWCHKTAGSNETIWFSAGKFQIFVTPYRFSNILPEGQKNESMTIQEKAKGNNLTVRASVRSPFHCNCKRLLPYLWQHTNSSIFADIESTICPVIYNISPRGDQLTSLANLFTQNNELLHLFCTWEEEMCEKFDRGSVHFRVL
jgi:hypothetical protein